MMILEYLMKWIQKMSKTKIHVNQHIIKKNTKTGLREPVFTVKTWKSNERTNRVKIKGPATLVYSPDKPLDCGAKCWIETETDIECDNDIGNNRVSTPDLQLNIFLVPYGYQVDLYEDGKLLDGACRDFGGSHKIRKLKDQLINKIGQMIKEFREYN